MPDCIIAKYFDPDAERHRLLLHDYLQTEIQKMRSVEKTKLFDSLHLPLKSSEVCSLYLNTCLRVVWKSTSVTFWLHSWGTGPLNFSCGNWFITQLKSILLTIMYHWSWVCTPLYLSATTMICIANPYCAVGWCSWCSTGDIMTRHCSLFYLHSHIGKRKIIQCTIHHVKHW